MRIGEWNLPATPLDIWV